MKISEGKIVESTIYPGLKSIRSIKTTSSEQWFDVSDAEARGIREIFEPFNIGETVVILSKKEFRAWLEDRISEYDISISELESIIRKLIKLWEEEEK